MLPVMTTGKTLGKIQMRHILFHELLALYQHVMQLNRRFYRTGVMQTPEAVIMRPRGIGGRS
jgi:hypothetical protein